MPFVTRHSSLVTARLCRALVTRHSSFVTARLGRALVTALAAWAAAALADTILLVNGEYVNGMPTSLGYNGYSTFASAQGATMDKDSTTIMATVEDPAVEKPTFNTAIVTKDYRTRLVGVDENRLSAGGVNLIVGDPDIDVESACVSISYVNDIGNIQFGNVTGTAVLSINNAGSDAASGIGSLDLTGATIGNAQVTVSDSFVGTLKLASTRGAVTVRNTAIASLEGGGDSSLAVLAGDYPSTGRYVLAEEAADFSGGLVVKAAGGADISLSIGGPSVVAGGKTYSLVRSSGQLVLRVGGGPVPYLDPTTHATNLCETYTLYDGRTELTNGWWVVADSRTVGDRIMVSGDVHLILVDGKTLTATNGVDVAMDGAVTKSLTIWAQSEDDGMGALTAVGEWGQAGIGGGFYFAGGKITVNGGAITATGGDYAAGVGGGSYCAGGKLTVNGGAVTATGGKNAAGIGGGYQNALGGEITINGGAVTAKGDEYAAGIGGGGYGGVGGTITINGGTVAAKGGDYAAGIGGGFEGAGGTVTITGGTVTATGSYGAAGIGGGYYGDGGTVVIDGGTVTAAAGSGAQAVGKGRDASASGTISFYDDAVVFTNALSQTPFTGAEREGACRGAWARIVPGSALNPVPYLDPTTHTTNTCYQYTPYDGRITLDSGWWVVADDAALLVRIKVSGDVHLILCDGKTLTATNGINVAVNGATTNSLTVWAQSDGEGMGRLASFPRIAGCAAIGCGMEQSLGRITINGGTIVVTSGNFGAGIGGGEDGVGGTIVINGGTVTATGGKYGAGIGGGYRGSCGTVVVNGGIVTANGGESGGAGIGGGQNSDGGTVVINGGTVTASAGEYDATMGVEPPQAIGHGFDATDPGRLDFPGMKVYDLEAHAEADEPVASAARDGVCRGSWAKLVVCDPHSYANGVCEWCGGVPYLDPTDTNTPVKVCTDYTTYDGRTTLDGGWYVVADSRTVGDRIVVSGDVHIILVDGKTLAAPKGVNVGVDGTTTNSLTIWAQSDGSGMGALWATGGLSLPGYAAGIGGGEGCAGGMVAINGGGVTAIGGGSTYYGAAGIGGGKGGAGGTVTISGGTVTARGGSGYFGGAGIGGGYAGAGGSVTVNGGKVDASGGMGDSSFGGGAGIGGGNAGAGGTVTINGGTVTAKGGKGSAGIGGGHHAGGSVTVNGGIIVAKGENGGAGIGGGYGGAGGDVTVNGGTVTATGCDAVVSGSMAVYLDGGGAGIGGGYFGGAGGTVTITGGTVTARGGSGGAGIGGGSDGAGGTVTITGGEVTARGGGAGFLGGAGIGGGNRGAGGELTITGGTVTAIAGAYAEAVGHGSDATDEGDLDIPDTYCAYSPETNSIPEAATNRMAACRGERVKLTLCDPHGYADYRNNGANHTRFCRYCGAEGATEDHAYVNYVCPCGAVAPAAVSNVQAAASSPWDGTVGISFYVTNSPATGLPDWNRPFLSIVATDNMTGSNYVSSASALTGQTDAAEGAHEVTWDMRAQGISLNSTNVTFTVAYLVMPDYCVIDLSGGTGNGEGGTGNRYPVSYLDGEPDGGFTNDLYRTGKLAMRLIAPGTFQMGVDGSDSSNPSHTVTLTQPFYCAVFETTQRQWELVNGPHQSEFAGDTRPVERVSYNDIRGASLGSQWPETNSVDEASFLGVLRLKTGLAALDLPTDAQWEYACRAGTTNSWCFGDAENEAGDYMWYHDNSTNQTHVVGTKRPNAWGLYDMHGNVWEWCLDRWSETLSSASVTNPPGSSSGSGRVLRGGSWLYSANYCTSSFRNGYYPSRGNYDLGFRLVRTLSDDLEGERGGEAAAAIAERAGTVCAGAAEPIEVVPLRPFADGDIVLTNCVAVYDGEGHTIGVTNNVIPGLTLRYASGSLGELAPPEFDATLPEYTDVTNVVIFVEASAPGYYTTTNSATVKITPLSLSGATIEPIPDQYYEGTAPTPAVTVLIGGLRPAADTDYDATYTDNEGPGTATVTLTGKGNYTGEAFATFQILAAPRSLAVTAGKWGRVMVVVDGATNWVATGTADIPVGYGSSVTATADPDAGFAVLGGTNSFSFASFTNDASVAFSFVPNPAAALRWKYASAVGRYFAQVAVEAHAGYAEALEGLAYIFADRTNNVGDVYAQLWNVSARGPENVLVTDNGVEYRGVTLGSASFAGMPDGTTNVFGVADASFREPRNIVPAGERQIGLYVRKRVDPVSGNETVAEVENFLGYLTWTTDGTRWFLPIVEGANSSTPNSSTPNSSLVTRHSSLAFASRRAYAPATLNAAVALGLGAETVAENPPTARIAAFSVDADGAVSGRIEAVSGGEASSSFGGSATVRVLSAETPAGPWREASAAVDPATGAFSLPAGAVEGHFFRAEIETRSVYE